LNLIWQAQLRQGEAQQPGGYSPSLAESSDSSDKCDPPND